MRYWSIDFDWPSTVVSIAAMASAKDLMLSSMRVADAGYYLVTGRSFRDERVTVLLLGRQDYLDWIESSFEGQFAIRNPSEYESLAARLEVMRARATGFKTRHEGKITVVVDAEIIKLGLWDGVAA